MKMQAARSILAFGLAIGTAGAALAGPTTTGTPTTTTEGPTTTTGVPTTTTAGPTTTTGVPTTTTAGPTTTTGVPTTTTAGPTTTTGVPTTTTSAPTTTTASPTTTTSTTLLPGDLSGERFFVDKKNFDKNETLMNVDTQTGAFCLAGRAAGVDPTTTFNRLVVFTYSSLGTISKANTKSVKGDFVDVLLQLTIDEQNPDGAINEFTGEITTGCKLKGSLKKEGEEARATLQCDVGENLSAFGLEQAQIENVANAFAARKNLVVKVRKGKIKFTHRGEPAPGDLTVPLTCDLGGNGNGG